MSKKRVSNIRFGKGVTEIMERMLGRKKSKKPAKKFCDCRHCRSVQYVPTRIPQRRHIKPMHGQKLLFDTAPTDH
jgi:hypothetical protein